MPGQGRVLGFGSRKPMKIRAITLGVNLEIPFRPTALAPAGDFMRAAKEAFEDSGFEIQTTRLATQPLEQLWGAPAGQDAIPTAAALEQACLDHGIDYVSLGTVLSKPGRQLIPIIPDVIAATERCFLSVSVASREAGIDLAAIRGAALAIKRISEVTPEGFGNHRFAALANCPPNIPFFPGAYHAGGREVFTLGLESADLAVEAFQAAASLEDARARLVRAVEGVAARLQAVGDRLADEHGIAFGGIDFSTAPFPVPEVSTANAVEQLGVDKFGASGTLFAAACITDSLRRSSLRRAGYCGLFLPVLEDSVLAGRNTEGLFTLDSLLLYSAVCGTGLDTIPLPGDVSVEELASIVLDVATLAVVLDKPLTCRLMPIPGRKAGEMTNFAFPFFANTRVVSAKGLASERIVAKNETVRLGIG